MHFWQKCLKQNRPEIKFPAKKVMMMMMMIHVSVLVGVLHVEITQYTKCVTKGMRPLMKYSMW